MLPHIHAPGSVLRKIGKKVLVTLGPHLDKEGQLIVVTTERGPSNFLETTRNRSCKYIARNKEASLVFPVPELLAEMFKGKEHSEDPQ